MHPPGSSLSEHPLKPKIVVELVGQRSAEGRMVRTLQISGLLALGLACAVFALCVRDWRRSDMALETVQGYTSAVEKFKEMNGSAANLSKEVAPLIAQAEALAAYLNPPKEPEREDPPTRGTTVRPAPFVPSIRPAAPSVKFRLHGTSYYPNQPGRSMALIAEPSAAEGNERWVKEGSHVGHFVIHEIRHGAIVYRDGDNLREMAIEAGMSTSSIVRDTRPGTRQVSAAIENVSVDLPIPAGPNGIELAAGN
jgi:hypothetical protein